MSSLPFLAPVFVRKAKAYRSKGSGGYDSSGGRSRSKGSSKGRSTKEHYPLNDFDAAGSAFPGDARVKSESEEFILERCATAKADSIRIQDDVEVARPRTARDPERWR